MIEKWQKSLDVGGHAGIVLIDLSKPLDSVHFFRTEDLDIASYADDNELYLSF